MDKKTLFNEALEKLVSTAANNKNKVSMEEVQTYFDGLIDDNNQYPFIYDYLSRNNIEVEGFTPSDKNFVETKDKNYESKEELEFIRMYMTDMDTIPDMDLQEQNALIEKLLSGDISCTEKLVESKLKTVADIAEKYRGRGVSFGDLIQEGNLELMIAISEYHETSGDFHQYIYQRVENAIVNTINNEMNSDRIGQHLADKLNRLDRVTKELNQKLGRVPELSELSEAMGISEDEASLLLKTSLDTLSVNEDTHITDTTPAASAQSDPLKWRKHTR